MPVKLSNLHDTTIDTSLLSPIVVLSFLIKNRTAMLAVTAVISLLLIVLFILMRTRWGAPLTAMVPGILWAATTTQATDVTQPPEFEYLEVIDGIADNIVYYNDPAAQSGEKQISTSNFLAGWKKRFIVIRPT